MKRHIPKISVIVPVYNVDKYLDRCLNSIVNQTLKDMEIIIIDDGSTDGCPSICDRWSKKDARIRVVHKQNAGLGMARNSGLDIATGEYVIFCDSDDKVDKKMYESLYEATENCNYDVVYSGFNVEQKNGHWLTNNDFSEVRTFDASQSELLALSFIGETNITNGHRFVMSCNVALYRRSLLEKFHIRQMSEREVVSEDLIFQLQVALHINKVKFIPQCFYYYYMNGGSLTHTFKESKFPCTFRIRKEMLRVMPKSEYNLERIDAEFYSRIRSLISQLVCESNESFRSKYRILSKLCQYFTTIKLNENRIKLQTWKYGYALKLIKKKSPFRLILFTYFDRYINKKNLLFWKNI